jgi:hypothetical protein
MIRWLTQQVAVTRLLSYASRLVLLTSHMYHLLMGEYATMIRNMLQLDLVFADLFVLSTQIL